MYILSMLSYYTGKVENLQLRSHDLQNLKFADLSENVCQPHLEISLILITVSFPIHEYGIFLHFFRSSLPEMFCIF